MFLVSVFFCLGVNNHSEQLFNLNKASIMPKFFDGRDAILDQT